MSSVRPMRLEQVSNISDFLSSHFDLILSLCIARKPDDWTVMKMHGYVRERGLRVKVVGRPITAWPLDGGNCVIAAVALSGFGF